MADIKDILVPIELHDVEGINNCFAAGLSPNATYLGQPLLFELTSEYTRGPRFKDCVQAFIDAGLLFADRALLAVLADDPDMLLDSLQNSPETVHKKYTLRCAYTPLDEVTLLHICAEFNQVRCARLLVEKGAAIDAKAGLDKYGFGGQTPLFHTVNQNGNHAKEMLDYLLTLPVDLQLTVKGIIWGKGYAWETLVPAVNPVSYAMMGLLPQMHRDEKTIAETVSLLLKKCYDLDYVPQNIPNSYLHPST